MAPRFFPLVPLLVFSVLAGCASNQHASRREGGENYAHRTAGPGYLAEQKFATIPVRESWSLGADTVEVSMLMPQGVNDIPLVIYLPGLGESVDSGVAWRKVWAEAGYAVVSLQPDRLGKGLLPPPSDHSGDFSTIAREQYAPTALSNRLALVASTLDELKRRSRDPQETVLAHLDFNRIAVAGFDLGAQTAMAVAGELFDSASPFKGIEGVKCVIALSPYAGFSGPGFEQRFGTIRLPVLSVTSMDDTDPYGVVSTPAIHQAPFQYMPPGRKYLLALYDVPHSLIGGSETPPAISDHESNPARSSENEGSNPNTGGHRHGRGRGNYGGGGSSGESSGSRQVSPSAWSDQLKLIQSVSTAYLDAMVKMDPEASSWLAKDANRWLGESAELTSK